MRRAVAVLLALAVPLLGRAQSTARWQLSYVAGYTDVGDSWAPARHQVTFGIIDADVRPGRWPVAIATRLALAYTPAVPPDSPPDAGSSGSYEFNIGIRRDILTPASRLEPRVWIGGGAAVLGASIRSKKMLPGSTQSEWQLHDATMGPYAEVGGMLHLRGRVFAGLDVTWARGRARPATRALDVGGMQILALFGARLGQWTRQ